MKPEFIVERDGKSFVLYAGLLDEAHQQGLKAIRTTLIQIPSDENGVVAICQAVVETEKGTFSGIGDASPANVTRIMAQHIIRMAETRAKARALRDAVNVGAAALEELGPEISDSYGSGAEQGEQDQGQDQPRRQAPTRGNPSRPNRGPGAAGDAQATPAQVNAIYAIGRREFRWAEEEVDAHARSQYGKAAADLTKREASEFIDRLKTNPGGIA